MIRAILTSGSMRSLRHKPDRSCATKPGHISCHRQALVLQLHQCCRCGPLLGGSRRGRASMSVAVWSGSLVAWERELAALKERIGPVFGRAETRATAGPFLDGLLSEVARKT